MAVRPYRGCASFVRQFTSTIIENLVRNLRRELCAQDAALSRREEAGDGRAPDNDVAAVRSGWSVYSPEASEAWARELVASL